MSRRDSPGADKESNWLPADGQFFMIMRTYLPADDIVNQTWQPPKVLRPSTRLAMANRDET